MTPAPDIRPERHVAADERAAKSEARAVWASGDYHRFATHLIWDLGALLVDATGIGEGQDVLDVACGTGNTALRAAARGACVVGCDLTPENFPAGVRAAADLGVEIQWVEGDAEALPFDQASFDVVVSSVGAMWAPNHQAVADELVRVCRPGGIIGMINFAAGGLIEEFLAVFEGFRPPPPRWASSPSLWGDVHHVRHCSVIESRPSRPHGVSTSSVSPAARLDTASSIERPSARW